MINTFYTIILTVAVLQATNLIIKQLRKNRRTLKRIKKKQGKRILWVSFLTLKQVETIQLLKVISKGDENVCEAVNKALYEYGYEEAGGHSYEKAREKFSSLPEVEKGFPLDELEDDEEADVQPY